MAVMMTLAGLSATMSTLLCEHSSEIHQGARKGLLPSTPLPYNERGLLPALVIVGATLAVALRFFHSPCPYLSFSSPDNAAWAAARRATGTR